MRKYSSREIRVKQLSYAVSVAVASIIGNAVAADTVTPAAPTREQAAAARDEVTTVLVIGARQSQQNAIARKKNAATAQDSIVAEDVGAFPDRNVAEAISRIAGVAIDRGEFGEGSTVSIRGGSPADTRIELDGQGVQVAGGTDLNGGGDGRGVELRELSSDLIKSVDVVKGSTADMTEGALGGGVIIKTRTGLDFKKPSIVVRLGASQGSLNKKVSPNVNLILANKFLNDRLGVLLNVTKSKLNNESHSFSNGGSNGVIGYYRLMDFDNSPEKTFTYNPDTVSKTDPLATTKLTSGTGATGYVGESPLSLITKSAAAKTKDDCVAAFPNFTAAQLSAMSSSVRTAANNQRAGELATCLNQWNDYTPSLMRQFVKRQVDSRLGGDLRFDFKVNDSLTVYTKFSRNKREIADFVGNLSGGDVVLNKSNSFTDVAGVRTLSPVSASNPYPQYLYPGYSGVSGAPYVSGVVANVIPGSIKVDATHHVTDYSVTDGGYNIDQSQARIVQSSEYSQVGGTYKKAGLKVEFMLGNAQSEFSRYEVRFGQGFTVGETNYHGDDRLLYSITYPAFKGDPTDPKNFTPVLVAQGARAAVVAGTGIKQTFPAYTSNQLPLVSGGVELNMQAGQIRESHEKSGKIDLTYALSERIPYFTSIKTGIRSADTQYLAWNLPGSSTLQESGIAFGKPGYVEPVIIPGARARTRMVACTDTPGSLAPGGQPCQYGFVPSNNANSLTGTYYVTPTQYSDILAQSLIAPNTQFYSGAKDRPSTLTNGWKTFDLNKVWELANVPYYNLDCIKTCVASDGLVHDQPKSTTSEKVTAAYLMADFEIDHLPFSSRSLPFGIELNGNIGYRVVRTEAAGTGFLAFATRRQVAGTTYDPQLPLSNTVTSTVRTNTSVIADTRDFMPIYNLALWAVPNKLVLRYNRAKTIVRPGISKLLPTGTCTYDTRPEAQINDDGTEADMACTGGTMGNPALKAQSNTNQNLSAEWYVNKDTMLTASVFKQEGKVGAPTKRISVTNAKLFSGSGAVDPGTGASLDDVEYTYSTWANEDPSTRRGVEISSKTAFTFLPWRLRYTGLDANYTRVKSVVTIAEPTRELMSGDLLPPAGEPRYSFNTSLWYDDGALSARLAMQFVASKYNCIANCGASISGTNVTRNYVAPGGSTNSAPYNPGLPIFNGAQRYIDGKIAYKFKNGVEVFLEGRNLGMARGSNGNGPYGRLANGNEMLTSDFFAGRLIMIGMTLRSM